jgi:histidyl-tRNA synthetase
MSSKPSIPRGTRDFSTGEMLKREYIFETIRQVFRLYGYQPIETPAMENLTTLLGKYGEEGDKLLFTMMIFILIENRVNFHQKFVKKD